MRARGFGARPEEPPRRSDLAKGKANVKIASSVEGLSVGPILAGSMRVFGDSEYLCLHKAAEVSRSSGLTDGAVRQDNPMQLLDAVEIGVQGMS